MTRVGCDEIVIGQTVVGRRRPHVHQPAIHHRVIRRKQYEIRSEKHDTRAIYVRQFLSYPGTLRIRAPSAALPPASSSTRTCTLCD